MENPSTLALEGLAVTKAPALVVTTVILAGQFGGSEAELTSAMGKLKQSKFVHRVDTTGYTG